MIVDGFVGQSMRQPSTPEPVRFALLREFFTAYQRVFFAISMIVGGGFIGYGIGAIPTEPAVSQFTVTVNGDAQPSAPKSPVDDMPMTFCGFNTNLNGSFDYGRLLINDSWYELPDDTPFINLDSIKELELNGVYRFVVDTYTKQIITVDGMQLERVSTDYTCTTPTTI